MWTVRELIEKGTMIPLFVRFCFIVVPLARLYTPIKVASSDVEYQDFIIQPLFNQNVTLVCHWLYFKKLRVTSIKSESHSTLQISCRIIQWVLCSDWKRQGRECYFYISSYILFLLITFQLNVFPSVESPEEVANDMILHYILLVRNYEQSSVDFN